MKQLFHLHLLDKKYIIMDLMHAITISYPMRANCWIIANNYNH